MSRPNKKKIPTDPPAAGCFGQAFANLEITGLPSGPPNFTPHEATSGEQPSRPLKPGRVVLRRETAHRGGKCVVIVDGFDPAFEDVALQALAKRLRLACGCGGAVKGRAIELQGNQPTRIRELLVAEGFRVVGEG